MPEPSKAVTPSSADDFGADLAAVKAEFEADLAATRAPAAEPADPNSIATFVRHFWRTANPIQLGQMLPFPKAAGGSGTDNPLSPLKIVADLAAVKKEGDERWAKGDKVGAAAKYIESVIPLLGPMMSDWGNRLQRGEGAAVAGQVTGIMALPKIVEGTPRAIAAVPAIAKAAVPTAIRTTAAVGDVVDPSVIGVLSPRIGKAVETAQKLRARLSAAVAPTAPEAAVVPATEPPTPAVPRPRPRTINEAMEAAIAKARAAKPESATPKPTVAAALNDVQAAVKIAKVKLTAAETKSAMDLVREGSTSQDALETIVALRSPSTAAAELANRLGMPSAAEVSETVAARNASGTWKK